MSESVNDCTTVPVTHQILTQLESTQTVQITANAADDSGYSLFRFTTVAFLTAVHVS